MCRRGYFTKYLVRYTPTNLFRGKMGPCKGEVIMNHKTIIIACLAAFATPALAGGGTPVDDAVGKTIATCVQQGAVRTIDGVTYHLRPGEDFRVVNNVAYNEYGVQWKQRIQGDPAWAFAENVARGCINNATRQTTTKKY